MRMFQNLCSRLNFHPIEKRIEEQVKRHYEETIRQMQKVENLTRLLAWSLLKVSVTREQKKGGVAALD